MTKTKRYSTSNWDRFRSKMNPLERVNKLRKISSWIKLDKPLISFMLTRTGWRPIFNHLREVLDSKQVWSRKGTIKIWTPDKKEWPNRLNKDSRMTTNSNKKRNLNSSKDWRKRKNSSLYNKQIWNWKMNSKGSMNHYTNHKISTTITCFHTASTQRSIKRINIDRETTTWSTSSRTNSSPKMTFSSNKNWKIRRLTNRTTKERRLMR